MQKYSISLQFKIVWFSVFQLLGIMVIALYWLCTIQKYR